MPPRASARYALAFTATVAACHPVVPHAVARSGTPRDARTVVVAVVVDQLAAWVADERLELLPRDGGFARLRAEGAWWHAMTYGHAATDTAPGHATLFTGMDPRDTGVLANEVPGEHGARDSMLRDANSRIVGTVGASDRAGSSIDVLRVPTVADRLRAHDPRAFVASVSLKDRGAIFGGGRHPDAALWFDVSSDAFITSSAFAHALPAWATDDARTSAMQALREAPWTMLDAPWVMAHAHDPDAQRGEGDLDGFGTVFPHAFTDARRPAAAMRASPRGDDAVLALARDAIEAAPDGTVFLAVSLSSNDYVGHVFGPGSWEAWDELRRLDASLAVFMHALDARFGARGWSMVLSADHGVVPLPESSSRPWCEGGVTDPFARPCGDQVRLDPDAMARDLDVVAVRSLGTGHWVRGVADPYVYLAPEALALDATRRSALLLALTTHLRAMPGVAAVVDVSNPALPLSTDDATLAACWPRRDAVPPDDPACGVAARLARSIPAHIEPVLYVLAARGAFFDPMYTPGHGTGHGTPYAYDRTVPLLVRAPGRVLAGTDSHTAVDASAYAATLLELLGVERPRASVLARGTP